MNFIELQSLLIGKLSKNVSLADIAKALEVTRQHINQTKRNHLKAEQLKMVSEYFNVPLNELITVFDSENCIDIPVKGQVVASMGYGVTVFDESQTATYSISKKLADDLHISKNHTEIIFAQGNSMSPTIEGGDSLLVDRSKTTIYDGKIYCVRIEGQLYAKRLQKIPPNTVRVVSDNDKYRSFEIDLNKISDFDFQIIGEVLWWGRVAR
jgi:phage repressor protein C with HTH and peptisase S24 domain